MPGIAETAEEPRPGEKPGGDVASEFIHLGENLKNVLQAAWESEERKRLQKEIEAGLVELGRSLNQTVKEYQESPAGQRLRSEAEELRGRIRSGEVEASLREHLLAVLRKVNAELEKAAGEVSREARSDPQEQKQE